MRFSHPASCSYEIRRYTALKLPFSLPKTTHMRTMSALNGSKAIMAYAITVSVSKSTVSQACNLDMYATQPIYYVIAVNSVVRKI